MNNFKKRIYFFDKVVLIVIIDDYFIKLIEDSIQIINKIYEKLKLIHGMFLFHKTSILANKLIENILKKYIATCYKINDFNIKEHILFAMADFLSNKEYHIFILGEYIKSY